MRERERGREIKIRRNQLSNSNDPLFPLQVPSRNIITRLVERSRARIEEMERNRYMYAIYIYMYIYGRGGFRRRPGNAHVDPAVFMRRGSPALRLEIFKYLLETRTSFRRRVAGR